MFATGGPRKFAKQCRIYQFNHRGIVVWMWYCGAKDHGVWSGGRLVPHADLTVVLDASHSVHVTKASRLSEVTVPPDGGDLWRGAVNTLGTAVQRLQQQRCPCRHARQGTRRRRQVRQIPKFNNKVAGFQCKTNNICRRIEEVPLLQSEMETCGIEKISRSHVPVLRRHDGNRLQQVSFGCGRNTIRRLQQTGATVTWKPNKKCTPEMFKFS